MFINKLSNKIRRKFLFKIKQKNIIICKKLKSKIFYNLTFLYIKNNFLLINKLTQFKLSNNLMINKSFNFNDNKIYNDLFILNYLNENIIDINKTTISISKNKKPLTVISLFKKFLFSTKNNFRLLKTKKNILKNNIYSIFFNLFYYYIKNNSYYEAFLKINNLKKRKYFINFKIFLKDKLKKSFSFFFKNIIVFFYKLALIKNKKKKLFNFLKSENLKKKKEIKKKKKKLLRKQQLKIQQLKKKINKSIFFKQILKKKKITKFSKINLKILLNNKKKLKKKKEISIKKKVFKIFKKSLKNNYKNSNFFFKKLFCKKLLVKRLFELSFKKDNKLKYSASILKNNKKFKFLTFPTNSICKIFFKNSMYNIFMTLIILPLNLTLINYSGGQFNILSKRRDRGSVNSLKSMSKLIALKIYQSNLSFIIFCPRLSTNENKKLIKIIFYSFKILNKSPITKIYLYRPVIRNGIRAKKIPRK